MMMRLVGLMVLLSFACKAKDSDEYAYRPSTSTPGTPSEPTQHSDSVLAWETPKVPVLRRGERPPSTTPNYFDSRELGSGAAGIFTACLQDPPQPSVDSKAKCLCLADAARVNVRAGRALDLSAAQRKKCSRFATDASGASPYSKGLRVTTENIAKASLACNDAISKEYPLSFRTALCSCIVNSSLKFGSEAERVDGGRCNLVAKYLTNTGQNLTARQFAGLPRKGDSFAKATDAPATYPSRAYAADPPAAANKRPEETETEECDTDCKARKRGYGDAEDMAEDLGIDVDEANDMLEDE